MTDKAPENRVYIIVDTKTKKQVGKDYTDRQRASTRADKLDLEYGAVRYVVKPKIITETAAGGGTGGGAIAAAPFRMGMQTRSIKDYMADFYNKVKNRGNYSIVKLQEAEDLSSIISKLKGMENNIRGDHDNTVTYGVEDDEGNIMKVTVKKDQAKDFEHRLGVELAEIEEYKMSGFSKEGISMAELLYNLKQNFNIVDVEFPKIPEDVVYNADKASIGPDSNELSGNDEIDTGESVGDEFDAEGNIPDGDVTVGGDMGAGGDNLGGDLGGEGGEGDELGDLDNELNTDDESVEDFEEDTGEVSAESLLKSLLSTMKADAEAKKAEAEAEAEKARAQQAEYSYKASQAAVAQQEELLQMETELDAQKEREKEAKKLADLAKYRVTKAKGMSQLPESFSSILGQILQELDEFDSEAGIRKERANLGTQYRILPTDSKETITYKRQMMQQAAQQLNARLRAVRIRDQYNRAVAAKEQTQQTQQPTQATPNTASDQSSNQRM